MDLAAIQSALRDRGFDAWLFYDHHHRDPIAYRILGLPAAQLATRRWFYLIPAQGMPRKLVHRIESGALDTLPGDRVLYARWSELEAGLAGLLEIPPSLPPHSAPAGSSPLIAMQYSPAAALPAISLADAGTVERIRALGARVTSSADLITLLDATWTPAMLASHRAAGVVVEEAIAAAFQLLRRRLDARGGADAGLTEYDLQQWIVGRLQTGGLCVVEPPIVAVNANAGNPHYQPAESRAHPIQAGDVVLLDVWAKQSEPEPTHDAAYFDVTWMGYCLCHGESAPPVEIERVFAIVREARDAAFALARDGSLAGHPLRGCDLDRAARAVIEGAGLGAFFTHRTGHSLGLEVHASGPNLDDFETRDERLLLPRTAFTIEPGIYLPHGRPFGVRTEINVYLGERGAEVTSRRQQEIVRI